MLTCCCVPSSLRQAYIFLLPTMSEHYVHFFGSNDSHMLSEASSDQDILRPCRSLALPNKISAVAFGSSHALWLAGDGSVYTVGCNANGQCGFSGFEVILSPKRLDGLATSYTAVKVAAGGCHSAIVMSSGQTAIFGANDSGQSGHGLEAPIDIRKPKLLKASSSSSVSSSSLEVVDVALGDQHTLLLSTSARVYACGQGRFGALGQGDDADRRAPCVIGALAAAPIRQVCAGERHSAVLTFGGAVFTFGWARSGALGVLPQALGKATDKIISIPRLVPMLRKGVVQIATGGSHSLALLDDGTLLGFGRGASGGTPVDSHTPAVIALPESASSHKVTALAAGRSHSLALLDNGSVLSWGADQCGQTGLGNNEDVPSPRLLEVPSADGKPVHSISAGGHSSALLLYDGAPNGSLKGAACAAVGARTPATLSINGINELSEEGDWRALASVVQAVFGSPALCNASFAHEAAAGGGLRAAELEGVYKSLLRSFDNSPAVLSALRDSMPMLLEGIESAIATSGGGENANVLVPPSLLRAHGLPSSSALLSGASSKAQRAYRDNFILSPLATLLHNPLLSHASEASTLHRIAHLVDEQLSSESRQHLITILSKQPVDVFAARVVRPLNQALERAFISCRQGGGVSMGTTVALVRLLGLARDANEHAREEAAKTDTADAATATAGGGSLAPGSIPASEFYNGVISEHLDCEQDYVAWIHSGVQRRSECGSDWRHGFSFCSEAWVLNCQAKARLLKIEAAIKMHSSQQQARHAMMMNRGHESGQSLGLLLPKRRRLRSSNSDLSERSGGGGPSAPPEPPPANSPFLILRIRRSHLVEDSLDALAAQSVQSLLRPLRVVFEGEPGIDEGGVRKEFFQLLVDKIFAPDFGMFDWSEEARCYWFARSSAALEAEAEFLLVGLVLGLAIHNGVILDLHFPPLLWMRVMNERPSFKHLKQIAPDLSRGLSSLLTFDGDVESTFMADFTVSLEAFGAMTMSELKPGGAEIAVTNDNRAEYAELYAHHLLVGAVQPQFDAFMKGFLMLCDGMGFSLLSPAELEQLVCGVPHLDFLALQSNAKYDAGFHPEHPTVELFWEVVKSFGAEDQKRLLFFATGCDRAPLGGLGKLQFVVQRGGDDSMSLPTAHTCFNMITLPEYTSRAKMRDRLTIAIRNATGFGLQ